MHSFPATIKQKGEPATLNITKISNSAIFARPLSKRFPTAQEKYRHCQSSSPASSCNFHTNMAEIKMLVIPTIFLITVLIMPLNLATPHVPTCRSYCGNITVDYPFSLQHGCGHPGFRDLLFCINDFLMFHISSGSYRVLDIDYAYRSLSLHDPHLSTCDSIVLGHRGNGFSVEPWRSPYISASPDNVFMLLGCSAVSPLFQGFADRHLPCRNVSGMGCEEYYDCPAWDWVGRSKIGSKFGSGPPECCAVSFEAIKAINLTKLQCEGYSSAYTLAPLRVDGPHEWAYGIRATYSVQGADEFCRACEATGGTCGYSDVEDHKDDGVKQLCMCGGSNSTSNCDSGGSSSNKATWSPLNIVAGFMICTLAWIIFHKH